MFSAEKQQNINSMFAKFNSLGQLSCIICKKSIKNELHWNKHLKSKIHLENRIQLKMKIDAEKINDSNEMPMKRDISQSFHEPSDINLNMTNKEFKKQKLETKSDFKDNLKDQDTLKSNDTIVNALPEGFYDDRSIEDKNCYKNKIQDMNIEYQKFKQIIQIEEPELGNSKDDKIRDAEREIEEVEDLIFRWKKIENFHCKREEILKKKELRHHVKQNSDSDKESDVEESEIDLKSILIISLQTKKRC